MPAQLTTKAQVNGYRFLLRRLEHALVRRDVRMLHDPMRAYSRALLVGIILTVLMLGGCGVYGLIKPQGHVGDAEIMVSKDSGAMYVLIRDTLHPVLNLTSARLIVGKNEKPTSVADSKLKGYPRGPLVGIPGAPVALPGTNQGTTATWAVCDSVDVEPSTGAISGGLKTVVIASKPVLGSTARTAGPNEAVYGTVDGKDYLLYQGKRAEVDSSNRIIADALHIGNDANGAQVAPRPVSEDLLNALQPAAPIAPPTIPKEGQKSMLAADGLHVGSVFTVQSVDGKNSYYVALADGIQQVNQFAANVIRLADPNGSAQVPTLSPNDIESVPVVTDLPVADFPSSAPSLVGYADDPVTCFAWSRHGSDRLADSTLLLGSGLPIASDRKPVDLSTADGSGPGLDQAYVPPGSGRFVAVSGDQDDSTEAGALYYVSDSGVRYGILDMDTAKALGLGDKPERAPWSVISLLVAGPNLSQAQALVSYDGMEPMVNIVPPQQSPSPTSSAPTTTTAPSEPPSSEPAQPTSTTATTTSKTPA